ncbi:MAG: TetR/AcrR family transcriptional regulator [Frankia sp.]|nr:TetR/AcrR family transcriptional regulator [Frankia sp.]
MGRVSVPKAGAPRRRHAGGEATRLLLLETAERLFATRGIEAVMLREIQVAAGQSNSSVIGYHFGSKTGLVRALIAYRQPALDAERDAGIEALRQAVDNGARPAATARELVELVVGPLVSSIRRGELYVPFLARLSEDPLARSEYWPSHVEDNLTPEVTEQLVESVTGGLPARVRHARNLLFFTSVLHTLGDHACRGLPLSAARLSGYVDGWVGMLTAPVSPETARLLES